MLLATKKFFVSKDQISERVGIDTVAATLNTAYRMLAKDYPNGANINSINISINPIQFPSEPVKLLNGNIDMPEDGYGVQVQIDHTPL